MVESPHERRQYTALSEIRTVTFRLRAPEATGVELVGEVRQSVGPRKMTGRADGIWSFTIGLAHPLHVRLEW
jgi:1,4-alpha-glucan branching enzyme